MDDKIKSFKELRIWQKGIEIVKGVYELAKKLPNDEKYGLSSQIKRSAVSIPSNIAEGFKRFHNKEYKQYLFIALGSSAELETQIIIMEQLGFISKKEQDHYSKELEYLSKMMSSLIKKLK